MPNFKEHSDLATRFKIGTRKSAMALAQTEEIARRLTAATPDLDVEIVKFDTTGDIDQVVSIGRRATQGRGNLEQFIQRAAEPGCVVA